MEKDLQQLRSKAVDEHEKCRQTQGKLRELTQKIVTLEDEIGLLNGQRDELEKIKNSTLYEFALGNKTDADVKEVRRLIANTAREIREKEELLEAYQRACERFLQDIPKLQQKSLEATRHFWNKISATEVEAIRALTHKLLARAIAAASLGGEPYPYTGLLKNIAFPTGYSIEENAEATRELIKEFNFEEVHHG